MKVNETRRYHRAGTIELEVGLSHITQFQNKEHRYKVNLNGYRVNVSSNRLKTFIHSQSCPCCNTQASFFAIEKTYQKYLANPSSQKGYHINLYGVNKNNEEVLFTHDHTLARALGGADELHNTVTMCSPCNAHKGQLESKIKTTKSEKYKTILLAEIDKFLETGVKHTPQHPEPEIDQKPDSKNYLKKLHMKEIKKLYKKIALDPTKLTEEEANKLKEHENTKKEIYDQCQRTQPQSASRRKP